MRRVHSYCTQPHPRRRLHRGQVLVCAVESPQNHPRRFVVARLNRCWSYMQSTAEWDHKHVTARQPQCLGLTGGEARVPSLRRYVPRASRLHAGVSSALQCTCEHGSSTGIARRLPLASRCGVEQLAAAQHASPSRLGRRGGTAVMKDLAGTQTAATRP
jgi:hypothetical protein